MRVPKFVFRQSSIVDQQVKALSSAGWRKRNVSSSMHSLVGGTVGVVVEGVVGVDVMKCFMNSRGGWDSSSKFWKEWEQSQTSK